MKLSLQIKMGQQLTMTPQLQQAIRLLQLSTLDLQQEIQEALESNPLLEVDDSLDSAESSESKGENDFDQNEEFSSDTEAKESDIDQDPNAEFASEDNWDDKNIPTDLSVDSSWEDVYTNTTLPSAAPAPDGGDFDFESRNSKSGTLQDHLNWQLNLTHMSDGDRLIAMAIIDAIDPNGLLTVTIESIHASLIRELDIDEEEVTAVLHLIQQFDPVGVGYRDLKECLGIQLKHIDAGLPCMETTSKVINDYLPQLASHDYSHILKALKIKEPELKEALKIILSLNPKPGSEITSSDTTYVVPDVFVSKKNGHWVAELNPETAPKIRVNPEYAMLANGKSSEADNNFIKENLQEARWFIKSLHSRNETLMKVSNKIVEHQKGFLDYGDEAMKPLVLHDIAEAVGMHESTISRVTTQKYMHTPRGIFELKYFFSSHVGTEGGGECSSTAIRALIKKLVAAENPQKPLSDSKITQVLSDQGINIARRTIAKYRESLSIAPSNERKRLL
ncbi:RNA polymerase factor sigma-54 [Gammaproteobacteria bacterium]|nr:RNA polymerase factor sigma-54 [Gammaproteobacteria bacterium]